MGMDRNTVIGFVLIGLLLMGMLYMNNRSNQALQEQKKKEADSLAKLQPKVDTLVQQKQALQIDSTKKQQAVQNSSFSLAASEVTTILENEVLQLTFTNKGGQPQSAILKNFKTHDGNPVQLIGNKASIISYDVNAGINNPLKTTDLLFTSAVKKENADKSQTLIYIITDSLGNTVITHEFTMRPNEYMIDYNITLAGANKLITQNSMNLLWQHEAPQTEKAITYEKQNTHLSYVHEGKYDFETIMSDDDIEFDNKVNWLAVNPQFFVSALIAKNKFESAKVKWQSPADSLHVVARTVANIKTAVPENGAVALQLYYGPNDYNELKKYGNNLQQVVTYGSGPFSFVKYINRHILLPVWDFLRSKVASYGIVILLLTLFIRLLTSPILYKSYLSGAKMKVLKPEVDALKAKFTDKNGTLDQQAFSMEQMKLWRTAGVSPLGGCLPALLQIPIFMSLYYFFQANISLRGQSFLWAKDLAAYDSIYQLPFDIPFYGDHVSLFTLTATITSLLISLYSMSNMQDNNNPLMKYMPYIFPVLLLGVFNNLPSALTWYYTVSNIITLILQFVIQKYIINHDKIMAQIAENRKKPVKQNKFQERIQAMQEQQRKLQELKDKNNKK
jgi:YidC/Oxa1 family membrane protein insertase